MSQALDYSTARPDPAAIVAASFSGVLRYLAPIPSSPPGYGGADDSAKVIFGPEYAAIHSAGLELALNWEWYGNRAREGFQAGQADAQESQRQADALGYLGPRPVYFSVDYNAPPGDQFMINAYFVAAAQVIGLDRLGAYAGYWVLKRLFDAGLITYGWQALAWSGTNRESRAHLFQNGAVALGGDVNDILRPNWAGGAMVPNGWTDDGVNTLTAPNGQIVQYGFRKRILADQFFDPANVPFGGEVPTATGSQQDFLQYSFIYTTASEIISLAPLGQELRDCLARPPVTGRPVLTVRGDGLVQAACQ